MTEETGWLDGGFPENGGNRSGGSRYAKDYDSRGGATEFSAWRKNPARWWHSQSKESAPLEKIGD